MRKIGPPDLVAGNQYQSMENNDKPKVEVKNIKHTFTDKEANELGANLARAFGTLRGIENEFEQVKSQYKAKITEAESRIDSLSTARVNGFENRNERCVVLFVPKQRKKNYYLELVYEEKGPKAEIVLTEDMTNEDFAIDLFQAESKFEHRTEVDLFKPAGNDKGILVVGRFKEKWFTAIRSKVGKLEINERLDSEQKAFKNRSEAVEVAVKRFAEWTTKNLRDAAKGFEEGLKEVIDANKEKVE